MSFLVDTNVLSEPMKPRPNRAVVEWMESQPVESLFLSAMTAGEVSQGLHGLPVGLKRRQLTEWWLAQVQTTFRGRIIPFGEAEAEKWGEIKARVKRLGGHLPVPDTIIAATAIVHGLTVVTRDIAIIARAGAAVFNPWAE